MAGTCAKELHDMVQILRGSSIDYSVINALKSGVKLIWNSVVLIEVREKSTSTRLVVVAVERCVVV